MATAGKWSSLQPELTTVTINAVKTLGMKRMTPVQAASIPPLLQRKDVVVHAQTGSGKTLSFLVPLVEILLSVSNQEEAAPDGERLVAVIIEPTRELAQQVHEVATELFALVKDDRGRGIPPPALLCGGVQGNKRRKGGVETQVREALEKGQMFTVCIATPGRLEQALSEDVLQSKHVELLVLDEADRLLDLGFEVTLSRILEKLPKQRRTGLYSATQTTHLHELTKAGLRNPIRVRVQVDTREVSGKDQEHETESSSTPASLIGEFHVCRQEEKLPHLLELIASRPKDKFIVYFLTCALVDYHRRLDLSQVLAGRPFMALSGKVWQKKRSKIMSDFRSIPGGVLLCTDVASRGLDVPDVDCVVQMDPPQDPRAYIHRVGRTARLGRSGKSLLYLTPTETEYVDLLRIRKCSVEEFQTSFSDERLSSRTCEIRSHGRNQMLSDRAYIESAEMAYLSYLRAYKEHHCSHILRFEDLDAGSVARSLNLLRLPRISEFKQFRKRIDFEEDKDVDYWSIPFKDAAVEKLRQEKIKIKRHEAAQAAKEREKAIKAKKRQTHKRTLKNNGFTFDEMELEELSRDASLVRKQKRRKKPAQPGSDDE